MSWIKLHRKILQWEWYSDANVMRLFIHLLLSASYEDTTYKGHKLRRGQIFTTLRRLAKETGLTLKTIRVSLDKLVESKVIKIFVSKNSFTIVTICKYESYQGDSKKKPQKKGTLRDTPKDTQKDTQKAHPRAHLKSVVNNCDTDSYNADSNPEGHTEGQTKGTIKDTQKGTQKGTYIRNKEIKENNNTTTTAREANFENSNFENSHSERSLSLTSREPQDDAGGRGGGGAVPSENLAEWLEAQPLSWKEVACMQLHIHLNDLPDLFRNFQCEVIAHGQTSKQEKDIQPHFMAVTRNFLTKKRKNDNEIRHSTSYTNSDAIRIAANIAATELAERARMEAQGGWDPDM